MMKIILRLHRDASAAKPPPPPPPPSAAAGGQTSVSSSDAEGSGAGGPAPLSESNSGSHQNLKPAHNKHILGGLAVEDGFLQWSVGKRSRRKWKKKSCRRATLQFSDFGGESSSGGGSSLKHHGNVGSPISRSRRNLEDKRMVVGGGSSISKSVLGKRSHSAAEKTDSKKALSSSLGGPTKKKKPNDSSAQPEEPKSADRGAAAEVADLNKGSGVVPGLPSIVIELSKKEKEEDFLQMTGTKLPQKPKKRSRAVERRLLYCFPGASLFDVSSSKYEVREKRRSRKSRRKGLKGVVLDSSDSE